jgi:extradiol dioxygenase family protein
LILINNPPFHLAFPVTDLDATRRFYADLIGCKMGRSAERWVDFDFFGHQLSAHLVDGKMPTGPTNRVDGKDVPVQHFGAILKMDEWEALAVRLKAAGREFIIEPYIRFAGEVGEQATMFLLDPSGNALEFKAFKDQSMIFAT